MSDRDFQIGGKSFKLNKIDAMKQFHIVRRIAPILSELLPVMKSGSQIKQISNLSEDEQLESIAKFVSPLMSGLSRLSDADSEFVLHGLLSSVEMQQGAGNWARVSNGTLFMFQDLELPFLLQIAGRAFAFNLAGFFSANLKAS